MTVLGLVSLLLELTAVETVASVLDAVVIVVELLVDETNELLGLSPSPLLYIDLSGLDGGNGGVAGCGGGGVGVGWASSEFESNDCIDEDTETSSSAIGVAPSPPAVFSDRWWRCCDEDEDEDACDESDDDELLFAGVPSVVMASIGISITMTTTNLTNYLTFLNLFATITSNRQKSFAF